MNRSTPVTSDAVAAARGYHRTAEGMRADRAASLVFNVASVALEHYLIAICNSNGVEPVSHTFSDLMSDVESLLDVEPDVSDAVRSLDEIFGICSVDDYHHTEPTGADAAKALWACEQLAELILPDPDGEAA
ncbi:MAG: hypothetical protein QG671_223 [Actinomycetota bacterium]|nr:hypothetical protein [Actinomycetota bacterium]